MRRTASATAAPLETLRRDCPVLGRIVQDFAMRDLGESPGSREANPRARAVALAAVSAATSTAEETARHARAALASGATAKDLEEILYLTALYAGVPQAVEATRGMSALLAESGQQNW
jgi:alkylhydroperoxidase/carboxymuconolactone decarboxylase family protein YurZ